MVFLRNRILQIRHRNSSPRKFQLVSETQNNTTTSTAACIYDNRSQLLSIPPHTNGNNYPASWWWLVCVYMMCRFSNRIKPGSKANKRILVKITGMSAIDRGVPSATVFSNSDREIPYAGTSNLVPETENNATTSTTECNYGNHSQLLSLPPHHNASWKQLSAL
ncbi:hypothetical protein CDAR_542611 [Caerostris darwini]|uniref:Uncharacterized protein n=1 Tax=Caerostris darwini TaxID=1538125 RepID=A0AAV4S6U0_9ARAC|nr:hypothetical protein CDAR_542611 [Caerostris darwini]